MRFRVTAVLLLTIASAFLPAWGLNGEIAINPSNDQACKQAFADMVRSFQLYESLLQDVYPLQDDRIPVHGESRSAALTYLTDGFSEELARDIIAAYLQWNPELQKMVLVPGDGIPTLNDTDIDKIDISQADADIIVFQRYYEDCYAPGDCYLFSITLRRFPSAWKIDAIGLEEIEKTDKITTNSI